MRSVSVPALVIHGAADPPVDVSRGQATAVAIPNAKLVVIDGMGHDSPVPIQPRIVDEVAAFVKGLSA